MADYFYLISSLPKIGLGEKHDKLDFDEVYRTILENVSSGDEKLLRYMVYPNDNKNLIAAISRKYNKRIVHHFRQPSILPIEAMQDFHHHSGQMPHYMQVFLEENSEVLADAPISVLERKLLILFYKEVLETGDDFLVKYYQYELNLKNIVVALNSRLFGYPIHDEIIGENIINQQLIKSTASDLNIGHEFPYVESLSEALSSKDPNHLEYQIDSLLWNYIDDQVSFAFFSTYRLLGYTAQLLMIKRWMDLNKEEGKNRLNSLTQKVMENFKLPQLQK
jgi:hypothetical protein